MHETKGKAPPLRVGIVGAGAIGTYIAAHLARSRTQVILIGRSRLPPSVTVVRTLQGERIEPTESVRYTTDIHALSEADVCLVAVKTGDVPRLAPRLADVVPEASPVVSLQNGLENTQAFASFDRERIVRGVVSFNVVPHPVPVRGNVSNEGDAGRAPSEIRQVSAGRLFLGAPRTAHERRIADMVARLRASGLPVSIRRDIESVALGKLLLNLNNGVCAATGLGTRASLLSADARQCFALALSEAVRIVAGLRRKVARVGPVRPSLLPRVLTLPTPVFRLLLGASTSMQADAACSTLLDLHRGRPTEIGSLNGAIEPLARRIGKSAPINRTIAGMVRAHEARALAGQPVQFVSAGELLRCLLDAGRRSPEARIAFDRRGEA